MTAPRLGGTFRAMCATAGWDAKAAPDGKILLSSRKFPGLSWTLPGGPGDPWDGFCRKAAAAVDGLKALRPATEGEQRAVARLVDVLSHWKSAGGGKACPRCGARLFRVSAAAGPNVPRVFPSDVDTWECCACGFSGKGSEFDVTWP